LQNKLSVCHYNSLPAWSHNLTIMRQHSKGELNILG